MAKATVQAALGPVILRRLTSRSHTDEEEHYAELIMMVCILSIVVTAPVGAILISITGPRLLTKTKPFQPTEGIKISLRMEFPLRMEKIIMDLFVGWRRSHRPSLYDISIIDETEEREDPEAQENQQTVENTNCNSNKTVYTITK